MSCIRKLKIMTINKDVLVIGAGPAGISAAIYLSRTKYDFVLLENKSLGGKLNIITEVENYPGFLNISGYELTQKFSEQLKARNVNITYDEIKSISKKENIFEVICSEKTYIVRSIIIATGSSNKKSNVPGETTYLGKGISYCAVCDGFFYRNKDVVVFANESKGYKEALYLEKLVNKLYLVNDNNLDDLENDLDTIKKSKRVEFLYPFLIKEYIGDENGLTKVIVKNKHSNEEKELLVYGAFPFIGDIPSSYFLKNLNLDLTNGYINVNSKCETNVKGVFAAGDILNKSLKQIVTACSDGAIAATSAIKFLNLNK